MYYYTICAVKRGVERDKGLGSYRRRRFIRTGGAKIDSCRWSMVLHAEEIIGGGTAAAMPNGVANGDGRRKPILVLLNPK